MSDKEVAYASGNEKAGSGELAHQTTATPTRIRGLETSEDTKLHRGLKARHISMIAIGGALGTGLIVGTGKALSQAGPGSLLISYTFIGGIVFMVMAALGEMSAWIPLSAGFTGYATRYCHPSLGFALGWSYLFKYLVITPNQLTAAALVITFWIPREKVNPGVWIAIFLVVIFCINYIGGIKFFGEFEFWLSSFKVIVMLGIILFSMIVACGGGPNHDATGFRYWSNPGAFANYPNTSGSLGQFIGFWSVIVNATFAFLGTELVGVTAGEAQNPRKSIPKAIKLTFYRILVFYILSVLFVGMIVEYNNKELVFNTSQVSKIGSTAAASPFVVAAKVAGVPVLAHIINGCILVFVLSASNSDLYIASRTLYGLASDESAPAIFRRTDSRGVPYPALFVSTAFACLAFMNVSSDSKKVFDYFVNLTTIFGLLAWISILVTHLYFVRARKAQGIDDAAMPYVAPQGFWGTCVALFFCIIICITKNFTVFLCDKTGSCFNMPDFITGYIGIPVYLIMLFGHMIVTKSKGIKPHEVDFYTGKNIIDDEEQEYLEKLRLDRMQSTGARKFYHRYVSWLF